MSLMLVDISELILDEKYLKDIFCSVAEKRVIVSGGAQEEPSIVYGIDIAALSQLGEPEYDFHWLLNFRFRSCYL